MTQPTTPLRDDELRITRTFAAPAAQVFRLWTEASQLKQWLGPRGFECSHCELNASTGGTWRASITSVDRGALWMGGMFREVVADRRLALTFAWDSGTGEPGLETLITVTLEPQGDDQTALHFHQAPFDSKSTRDRHAVGWNEALDKAQRVVEHGAHEDV